MKLMMRLLGAPAWLLAPSLALVAAIGATVAGYSPLVFDPSLYQANSALASELAQIDAEALESKSSAPVGGAAGVGEMEDGTWTGYAVCGEGNTDDWKPYYVAVTIEVKDNKVVRITDICGASTAGEGSTPLTWDPAENQEYLDHAAGGARGVRAQMEAQIAESGAVTGIDAVSGATFSSTAIYNALVDAMKRAAGEATTFTTAASAAARPDTSKKVSGATTSASLADGTWTGFAACGKGNDDDWNPYYVAVTIKVKDGKVVSIAKVAGQSTGDAGDARLTWNAAQNQKYLGWAISGHNGNTGVKVQMDRQVKAKGAVSGIDTVSGATYSSEAIYEAYGKALAKSAKAAGAKSTSTKKAKKTKKKSSGSTSGSKKVSAGDEAAASATLSDGTWEGFAACGEGNDADWSPYYVSVTVKVEGGKASAVQAVKGTSTGEAGAKTLAWNAAENQRYLDWAAKGRTRSGMAYAGVVSQIDAALSAGKSVGSIDTVSGATYSSTAIFKAYYAALSKSAAAAGSTIDDPSKSGGSTDSSGGGGGDAEGDNSGASNNAGGEGDDSGNSGSSGNSGDAPSPAGMADGTYEGHGFCEDPEYDDDWDPYYIIVQLKVENGAISEISDIYGDAEGKVDASYTYQSYNAFYLNRAVKGAGKYKGVQSQLAAKLAQGSAVSGIDAVSGATFSSDAVVAAFKDAASQAEASVQ